MTACRAPDGAWLRRRWYNPRMRAGLSGLSGSVWCEAWRGRGDNPLLMRWRLGAGRAASRQPWWRRNPGLMLSCAALSAGATYILALLLGDYFSVQLSAVGSHAFMLGLLKSGVAVVAWAGLGMSLMWLLARLYAVAAFALALLGQGRVKDGALRDEALVSSAITDEQVVLAVVLYAWRMLSAPVLALSACAAVVYGLALMEPGVQEIHTTATAAAQSVSVPAVPWWLALLLAATFFELIVVGAYTGAACLALLLTVLGRGVGPLAPSLGAAQTVFVQALLAIATVASTADGMDDTGTHAPEAAVAGVALLLCATLAWLAYSLRPLRTAAAYAPLMLIVLELGLAALTGGSNAGALPYGMGIFPDTYSYSTFIAAVVPAQSCFSLGKALAQGGAATSTVFGDFASCGIYILLQCLLTCVFALLARAAVRRYRGGQP
jgi:hypothetical protein